MESIHSGLATDKATAEHSHFCKISFFEGATDMDSALAMSPACALNLLTVPGTFRSSHRQIGVQLSEHQPR